MGIADGFLSKVLAFWEGQGVCRVQVLGTSRSTCNFFGGMRPLQRHVYPDLGPCNLRWLEVCHPTVIKHCTKPGLNDDRIRPSAAWVYMTRSSICGFNSRWSSILSVKVPCWLSRKKTSDEMDSNCLVSSSHCNPSELEDSEWTPMMSTWHHRKRMEKMPFL